MEKALVNEDGKVEKINITKLRPSPMNSYVATEDIDDMILSIKTVSLLEPLIVIGPDEIGCYEILSGERRYRAALQIHKENPLDFETISCKIIGSSDMDAKVKQLVIELSNLEVRSVEALDQHRLTVIQIYHQMAESGDIEQEELAKRINSSLGLSARYGRMYNSIYNNATQEMLTSVTSNVTPSEMEKAKENGEKVEGNVHIPISVASRFVKYSEEEQKEAVERVNNGEKAEDVLKSFNKRHDKGKSNGKAYSGTNSFTGYDMDDFDDDDGAGIATPYNEENPDEYDYDDKDAEDIDEFDAEWNNYDDDERKVLDEVYKAGSVSGSSKTKEAMTANERRYTRSWLRGMLKKSSYNDVEDEDVELLNMVVSLAEKYRKTDKPDGDSEDITPNELFAS